MESLNHFSPEGHITFSNSLPQHTEVKTFPTEIIIKPKDITRESISKYNPVIIIYYSILIYINVFHISRLQFYSLEFRRILDFLFSLEQSISPESIITINGFPLSNDSFNTISQLYRLIPIFQYLVTGISDIEAEQMRKIFMLESIVNSKFPTIIAHLTNISFWDSPS